MSAHDRTEVGAARRRLAACDAAQETMPREELAALQLARLRDTVKNAYENVALHRARLDAAGARPGDIARSTTCSSCRSR